MLPTSRRACGAAAIKHLQHHAERTIRHINDAFRLVSVHLWLSSSRLHRLFCGRFPFLGPAGHVALTFMAGGTSATCDFLLSIGCNAGFALALIRGEKQQRFWILLLDWDLTSCCWAISNMHISWRKISARCWAWTGRSSRCRYRLEFRSSPSRRSLFLSTPILAGS